MSRIERLIEQKRGVSVDDAKKIDEYILWLTEKTLPQPPYNELIPAISETDTQQRIRVAAAQHGCSLWRNNSGVLKNQNGQPVRYGLGNDSERLNKVFKSSDLIGIGPGGVFMAVECKHPGWRAPQNDRDKAQWNFLIEVVVKGGIGFFASSVDDFIRRM